MWKHDFFFAILFLFPVRLRKDAGRGVLSFQNNKEFSSSQKFNLKAFPSVVKYTVLQLLHLCFGLKKKVLTLRLPAKGPDLPPEPMMNTSLFYY